MTTQVSGPQLPTARVGRLSDGRDGVVYSARGEWGYFDRGHAVRVVAPRDPHHGRIGTVTATVNDGGDMVHRVAFDDSPAPTCPAPGCASGDYYTAELVSAQTGGRRNATTTQPTEQD